MKHRSPLTDPQPQDQLSWRGYIITCTRREGDTVFYMAKRSPLEAIFEKHQDIGVWRGWAKDADVERIAGRLVTCAVNDFACGPCGKCGTYINHHAHVCADGVFCSEACCPAMEHWKSKKKANVSA